MEVVTLEASTANNRLSLSFALELLIKGVLCMRMRTQVYVGYYSCYVGHCPCNVGHYPCNVGHCPCNVGHYPCNVGHFSCSL